MPHDMTPFGDSASEREHRRRRSGAGATSLTVAAIADALDRLGHRDQVMHSGMRPVVPGATILGPAFTIQALAQPTESGEPYERELAAVDAIPSEAVVVFNAGGVSEAGIWGELLSTRALARGAIGAVIDGAVRDVAGIGRLGFPLFATAVHAADSYGRAEVVSFGEPIVCAGVAVRRGDLVAADLDGVVVIPAEVADQSLRDADAKLTKEQQARVMLRDDGATVRETYARYGVL
jgi:4-hydroxy-4-methyl-2-oxoglutarate aldolase